MVFNRYVDAQDPLPGAHTALTEPNGFVAWGRDLSVARLEEAYRKGIFPWGPSDEENAVFWWSPNPRMVLLTDQLRISRSLRKRLRQIETQQKSSDAPSYIVKVDTAFQVVMTACALRTPEGQQETWITQNLLNTYTSWHHKGQAHSIELWKQDPLTGNQLVGGLYGVSLGRMFFGESMFSFETNASKIALAYLVSFLRQHNVHMIDCQVYSPHLASLGAIEIDRSDFITHIQKAQRAPELPWASGWLDAEGTLHRDETVFP